LSHINYYDYYYGHYYCYYGCGGERGSDNRREREKWQLKEEGGNLKI
jgi:hypothetical protein